MRYQRKVISTILIFGMGLLLSGLGIYLLLEAFKPAFFDLTQLCISVILFGLGNFCLFYSYREGDIEVLNRQLILYNVFGGVRRQVEEHEIECTAIVEHKENLVNLKELILKLSTGERLKIYSYGLRRFHGFPNSLLQKNQKSRHFQAVTNYKRDTVGLKLVSIVGLIIFIGGLSLLQEKELIIKSDISKVEGVVEAIDAKWKKGRLTLWVYLETIEDHKFYVDGSAFSRKEKEALSSKLREGEQVKLHVFQREHEAKLNGNPPADFSFWEKHINYRRIDVLGLILKDKTFGGVEKKNESIHADNESFWRYGVMFFSLLIFAFVWGFWPKKPLVK